MDIYKIIKCRQKKRIGQAARIVSEEGDKATVELIEEPGLQLSLNKADLELWPDYNPPDNSEGDDDVVDDIDEPAPEPQPETPSADVNWDDCNLMIGIHLQPVKDGDRVAMVGVRVVQGSATATHIELSALSQMELPKPVLKIFEQLQQNLPQQLQAPKPQANVPQPQHVKPPKSAAAKKAASVGPKTKDSDNPNQQDLFALFS